MKKSLIFFDPYPRTEDMVFPESVAREFAGFGRVVTHFGSRAPAAMVESALPEVEVIVGQTAMPRDRLDRAPNLKAILNVKGNWEPNIDYAEAHRRGIHVLSAAPAMAPAVAEYCLAQAISLGRGLAAADAGFRKGTEKWGIAGNVNARSLFGSSVGLVGFGNLGKALVELLRPFGCSICAYDPWVEDRDLEHHGISPASLEQILSSCRFLFLLAGATTENEGFLDRTRLSSIRQDASVVLASRAEIVDFDAFHELAGQGRFRAAVDVFPEEPVAADSPVRKTPNVQFTSHLAGGMWESYRRICDMMVEDVRDILAGRAPTRMQRADPELAPKMRSR